MFTFDFEVSKCTSLASGAEHVGGERLRQTLQTLQTFNALSHVIISRMTSRI